MKNVRKLTEGAILLAAFTILLLLTIYVPVLGIGVNFFLSLPFILFAAKNDWKSILVFIIASLFISFIAGNVFAIPLALAYGTTGAVMGFLLQRNKGRTAIFLSGALVFLINFVIQYAVSIVFFKVNMIDDAINMMRDSLDTSVNMLKGFGQEQANEKMVEQMKNGLDLIDTLVPSLFVMSSFLMVFLIQLVSMPIVKRFGIPIGSWRAFRDIKLPKSLLWYYLVTMLASMLLHPEKGTYLFAALLNLSYILQLFMMVQGISFIFYFFHRRGSSKTIPIIITILSFLLPVFLSIVRILGIIDLGFDLRKRMENKQ
ncbi:YybS family protein [Neobacillus sp. PS3-34]|uniref:YybS family protein n=1 Tax=Neobacillus sp. PS3-34 TaxID=3070678 RepID=UPI0027E1C8EB|nr:YybS family protein [Neobacillus sp. PS3-34]WML50382.1 YybS family protein [Neobacillus sp. PS3-34]